MAPKQPTNYSNEGLNILVSGLDDKICELNKTVGEKFTAMAENIALLTTAINDFKEYKAEIKGMTRSTIFWSSFIVSVITFTGGLVINLMLKDIRNDLTIHSRETAKEVVVDYIKQNYEPKNVKVLE